MPTGAVLSNYTLGPTILQGILAVEVEAAAKAAAAASGGPVLLTTDGELAFWKTRAANLNAVFAQLQSERVRRVLQFLDTSRSTYCGPFAKLCREVSGAAGGGGGCVGGGNNSCSGSRKRAMLLCCCGR